MNEFQNPNGGFYGAPPVTDYRVIELEQSLAKINKKLKNANGISLFIAYSNIILGVLFAFTQDKLPFSFPAYQPIILVAVGIFFFIVSFGIDFKNRGLIIAAIAFMGIDTLVTLLSPNLIGNRIFSYIVTRVLILLILIWGLQSVFAYHKLKKANQWEYDLEISSLFYSKNFTVTPKLIESSIVSVIAIFLAIVGIANSSGNQLSLENWTRCNSMDKSVSFLMPTAAKPETIDDGDGTPYYAVKSENSNVYVSFDTYPDIVDSTYSQSDIKDFRHKFLKYIDDESADINMTSQRDGVMGSVDYTQVMCDNCEYSSAIRVFVIGDNVHMASIAVANNKLSDEQVEQLINSYFDSIQINSSKDNAA